MMYIRENGDACWNLLREYKEDEAFIFSDLMMSVREGCDLPVNHRAARQRYDLVVIGDEAGMVKEVQNSLQIFPNVKTTSN